MLGKTTLTATPEEQPSLEALSRSRDREEAEHALLSRLRSRVAQAFRVREDTARQWRSGFMDGGADALTACEAADPVLTRPKPCFG